MIFFSKDISTRILFEIKNSRAWKMEQKQLGLIIANSIKETFREDDLREKVCYEYVNLLINFTVQLELTYIQRSKS